MYWIIHTIAVLLVGILIGIKWTNWAIIKKMEEAFPDKRNQTKNDK